MSDQESDVRDDGPDKQPDASRLNKRRKQAAKEAELPVAHAQQFLSTQFQIPDIPSADIDTPPEQVALRAFQRGALLDTNTRELALQKLCEQGEFAETKTGKMLMRVVDNSDRAVEMLSLVGYIGVRHLRANGLTLAQIAEDLRLNINDLTAFMSQAPTASADAAIDEEAFADTKAGELLNALETNEVLDQGQIDLLQVRMKFLLEYNKRLSHRWAQRDEEVGSARMPTLRIDLTAPVPTAAMREQSEANQAKQSIVDGEIVGDDLPMMTKVLQDIPAPGEDD